MSVVVRLQSLSAAIAAASQLVNAADLLTAVNQALAVPPPEGNDAEIRIYASALTSVAGGWDDVHTDLVTIANSKVGEAWQSGTTSAEATQIITATATDMTALPSAFRAAAAALNSWADALVSAGLLDSGGRYLLYAAQATLREMGADSPNWVNDVNVGTVSADHGAAFHGAYSDACQGVGELLTAARRVHDVGQATAATLTELATGGVPAGPGGPIEGATAALVALGAQPPALGTPIADASAAANAAYVDLQALQNATPPYSADVNAKIADLQRILGQYDSNPLFATDLMQDLGPDGLLHFTTVVAELNYEDLVVGGSQARDPTLVTKIGSIETGLGVALATATNGQSEPQVGSSFTQSLLALRSHEYNGYNGYQIIGTLMHAPGANFDPAFVTTFANDVLGRENGNSSVWSDSPSAHYPLNDIDNMGDGLDPMMGAMLALSRDPTNAAAFLNPNTSNNLQYLLTQRHWINNDPISTVEPAYAGSYAALGAALQSATINTADPTSRGIMAHTIWAVGGQGTIPDGMQQPLTTMVGNYIQSGDVNTTYLGTPGALLQNPTGDPWAKNLPTASPGSYGSPTSGTHDLDTVLHQLGSNNPAYNSLITGETTYATGHAHVLAAQAKVSGDWTGPTSLVKSSATVTALLTQAQIDAVPAGQAGNHSVNSIATIAKYLNDQYDPLGKVPVVGSYLQQQSDNYIENTINFFASHPGAAAVPVDKGTIWNNNYADLQTALQQAMSQSTGIQPGTPGYNSTIGAALTDYDGTFRGAAADPK